MNTTTNTDRPKLKLNLSAKPLTLATNSNAVVTDASAQTIVFVAKPKSDDMASTKAYKVGSKASTSETISNVATDVSKVKNKDAKKNTKQADTASNNVVVSPEDIIKAKIKRHKEDYQTTIKEIDQNIIEETKYEIELLLTEQNLITNEVHNLLDQQYDTIEHFACAIASNHSIAMSGVLEQILYYV